jgi:hypothetical protein
MTTLPPFQLNIAPPIAPPISEVSTRAGLGVPQILCLGDDPATSRRLGSFNHDRDTSLYLYEWSSLAEFDEWREKEEIAKSIQFMASRVAHGNKLWTLKRYYVCSREWSGGKIKYEKKIPDWLRKKTSSRQAVSAGLLSSNILTCKLSLDSMRKIMIMILA